MHLSSNRVTSRLVVLVLVAVGGARCSSSSPSNPPPTPDAAADVSRKDTAGADTSMMPPPADAGPADVSHADATAPNDVVVDAGSPDLSPPDVGRSDVSAPDVASMDTAPTDVLPATDTAPADVPAATDTAPTVDAPATTDTAPTVDAPAVDAASVDVSPTVDASSADGGAPDVPPPPPVTGLVNGRSVPVTASTPLAVVSGAMLPANNATGVPVDTLLRIGFDGPPGLGTAGSITIHLASDGSVVDSITLGDGYAVYNGTPKTLNALTAPTSNVNLIGGLQTGIDQVRVVNYVPIMISGNTATIFPHNNKLAYNTAYYVTIDAGVLAGTISSTAFAGLSSATTWAFTTKPSAPTTLNVAADNSADFATVQGAIDAVAVNNSAALTVNIAAGVYQEILFIRKKNNITFHGTNNGLDAVIQYDNSDGFNPGTGGGQAVTTPGAAGTIPGYGGTAAATLTAGGRPVLLIVGATGIVLDGITIKNLHPQGSLVIPTLPASTTVVAGSTTTVSPTFINYSSSVTQAETLYFNTSFTSTSPPGWLIAKHSNFVSYQDTIQLKGFSWFYDCFVTGDTDFIWGNANAALFEQCEIKSRFNTKNASVVQSRAYLGYGNTSTPADYNTSYPGFVFLHSALTKEDGTFTAYLARSPGAATVSGTAAPFYYLQYDIVAYIGCTMDTHIAPIGWNLTGSNPPGANLPTDPVAGWREYHSLTPAGQPLDVSQRLANPSPTGTTANPGGSIQLSDANAATFFPDRATILHGATDGTYTTTGLATFNPAP